jgi:hypothetical protein
MSVSKVLLQLYGESRHAVPQHQDILRLNISHRAMGDEDGPYVAKFFYDQLFEKTHVKADDIPYALDYAVTELRKSGVPPERWATFIHMGARQGYRNADW